MNKLPKRTAAFERLHKESIGRKNTPEFIFLGIQGYGDIERLS